jgi:F0F1-type ATP synthase assembly protein I
LSARVGEYLSLGFLLPVTTVAGGLIGYLMDKEFGTAWMYIPGLILGAVGGFVELIRQLTRDLRHGK